MSTLIGLALVAGAVLLAAPRYQLVSHGSYLLRLETQTGIVDICADTQHRTTGYRCSVELPAND